MRRPTRKRLEAGLAAVFVDTHHHVNDISPTSADVDEFVDSYLQEFMDAARAFVAQRL